VACHSKIPADEQLIAPKTIASCVEAADGSWDVVLSCGHEAVFVIQPRLTEMGCAQCLDIYINRSTSGGSAFAGLNKRERMMSKSSITTKRAPVHPGLILAEDL
jgi:hypothetical protein